MKKGIEINNETVKEATEICEIGNWILREYEGRVFATQIGGSTYRQTNAVEKVEDFPKYVPKAIRKEAENFLSKKVLTLNLT